MCDKCRRLEINRFATTTLDVQKQECDEYVCLEDRRFLCVLDNLLT